MPFGGSGCFKKCVHGGNHKYRIWSPSGVLKTFSKAILVVGVDPPH